MRTNRMKTVVVCGVVGLIVPVVLIGVAFCVRLWATGFPPFDVAQDFERFPVLVIPLACTCASISALMALVATARPEARAFAKIAGVVSIGLGAAFGVIVVGGRLINSNDGYEGILRCLSACGGAGITYLCLSAYWRAKAM